MERFAGFIIKHKKWVLAIAIVLIVLSIVCTVLIGVLGKINSDMLTYLPDEMNTAKGQEFLAKNFKIEGDAMLVVQSGAEYSAGSPLGDAVKEIEALRIDKEKDGEIVSEKAVSQMIWYGTIKLYEDNPAFAGVIGDLLDAKELLSYLRQEAPVSEWVDENTPVYNYIFLGMLNTSASSTAAFDTIAAMREAFSSREMQVASEGMTHTADLVMNDTLSEIPLYLILGVVAVLLILLLATDSFLDPLVLLLTLGVSILVAMGSNIIFPSISIISFAVSAILQLAVTMDYAIIFMHIYKQKLAACGSPADAVKAALPNSFSSILASALTTVGGFLALFFMRFTLGGDLGMVLVKAVVMSLISVVILQPVLMVLFHKGLQKTKHKSLKITFEKTSKGVMKISKICLIVTIALFIPAAYVQSLMNYSYFKIYDETENPASYQQIATELRNQLVVAVPFDVTAAAKEEGKTPNGFLKELKKDEKVKNVISIFSVLKEDKITDDLINAMMLTDVGQSFFAQVDTGGEGKTLYTLYTIILKGDVEDDASRAAFARITTQVESYFGDKYFTMGMLTGINDMAAVTPKDFILVSAVSGIIIFLVLLLVLRNFRQSLMLILTIEIAIFLNLSLSVLMGINLNFMVYILISSVQLGCTVDYAILMATRYKDAYIETGGNKKEAARLAFKNSANAIIISGSIIISVCLCVLMVTKNLIISQMMELIARGGAISMLLVLLSLPSFLSFVKPTLSKKEKAAMAEVIAKSKEAGDTDVVMPETMACAVAAATGNIADTVGLIAATGNIAIAVGLMTADSTADALEGTCGVDAAGELSDKAVKKDLLCDGTANAADLAVVDEIGASASGADRIVQTDSVTVAEKANQANTDVGQELGADRISGKQKKACDVVQDASRAESAARIAAEDVLLSDKKAVEKQPKKEQVKKATKKKVAKK